MFLCVREKLMWRRVADLRIKEKEFSVWDPRVTLVADVADALGFSFSIDGSHVAN